MSMRILVIDDNKDIREQLKKSLQTDCFVVDTAGDGEEGSYMARINEYDVILLDNIMPKKNGLAVCEEIRASGRSTPIIVLSIEGEVDDKVELLNAGADDYVTKPFSYKELQSRIRALLRRPQPVVTPILRVDDLELDTVNQKARRGAREIYLTRKEFALVEYLMRNCGNVISRGELMEHVWNDELDPFSNTLEAHILNLRKKIDKPPRKKLICTIPGRGYIFNANDI
jgi:two-component system, OmpR family, copper resistance phosphate regulon response regulator CusR